jgi:hypothetical protein
MKGLIVYLILLSTTCFSQYNIDTSTVFLMHFDDDTSFVFLAQDTITPTFQGQLLHADGIYGRSQFFDSETSDLVIPTQPVLQLGAGDFTIEFWVAADTTLVFDSNNVLIPIITHGAGSYGWSFAMHPSNWSAEPAAIEFLVNDQVNGRISLIDTVTRIDVKGWHHICVRRYVDPQNSNITILSLEVDGILAHEVRLSQRLYTVWSNETVIGRGFKGAIDELRISKSGQVQAITTSFKTGTRITGIPRVTSVNTDGASVPVRLTLQGFPNPFNPTTQLVYELPSSMNVILEVYDQLGRKVEELYSGMQTEGQHNIAWHATSASGVYYVRLSTASTIATVRLLLLR